jgi:pimeloyl-ACP methyl ester carboxylesterase
MGCVMSTAIACLLCNNRCSIGRIVSNFAFFPPDPPSYKLEEAGDGRLRISFTDPQYQMAADRLTRAAAAVGVRVEPRLLDTARKERIALFHFWHPAAKATILWSHGNAMDIGEIYFFLIQLCSQLHVNVVAYDYSGYGGSTGKPSEANCYADIKAAYDYICGCASQCPAPLLQARVMRCRASEWRARCEARPELQTLGSESARASSRGFHGLARPRHQGTGRSSRPSQGLAKAKQAPDSAAATPATSPRRCGVDPASQLVLYGQSVGSAPSLWLANRASVASVVLHTPLLSGLRVLIPPHGGPCTVRAH